MRGRRDPRPPLPVQKQTELFEELRPGRLLLEHQSDWRSAARRTAHPRSRQRARAPTPVRSARSRSQWMTSVGVFTCDNRGRTSMSSSRSISRAAFSGDVDTRWSSSNHCLVLRCGLGNEPAGERFAERRVVEPPPKSHRLTSARRPSSSWGVAYVVHPRGERAVEHQVRHALGMLHRVRDRDGSRHERSPGAEIDRGPAASTTVSRSRTHVSKLTSGTSRWDMPLPRSS